MKSFHRAGVKLVYEDQGEGDAIILLHGLTGNRHMFDDEVRVLKKYMRVVTLDARGHGDSNRPSSYTLKNHIEDVIALIDHLSLETCSLLGVSMGSYIAQGVAIQLGERIKRLILVATKSEGSTSSIQELFSKHADELKGLSYSAKLLRISPYMYADLKAVGQWNKEAAKQSKPMTAEEIEAANDALKGFDFRDELHTISARTLVVSGEEDELNPPEKGKETATLIPMATFAEFKQSGHAPNVEQPSLFLDFLLEFLEKK